MAHIADNIVKSGQNKLVNSGRFALVSICSLFETLIQINLVIYPEIYMGSELNSRITARSTADRRSWANDVQNIFLEGEPCSTARPMHFLDQAKIFLRSGAGGPGAVSFRREKFIEYGGPDGGNGGKGGDIIFEAVAGLNTLIDFRYTQHFRAPRGKGGSGSNRTGAGGDDLVIKIPVGTQLLSEDKEHVLADFTRVGQRQIFLKGGDGGRGNASYKTSTNRAPRQHGTGWPSEEMWVWLRLKLLADIGLVGLPNAGKSTFINAVSNAKAKVGDYPFTTIRPQLGVATHHGRELVVADIPGLIEGAAEGAGIGDRFLGHIERCRVLLHLVDASGDDPVEAYETVCGELEAYGAGLVDKPQVVALNKIDAIDAKAVTKFRKRLEKLSGAEVMPLSAISGEGLDPVLDRLFELAGPQGEEPQAEAPTETTWSPI
jgi:GTP-binding protein